MVDALASGASGRKAVEVRILFPVPMHGIFENVTPNIPCRSSSVVEHAPEEGGVVSSILTFGTMFTPSFF
jgi:hypothetical protein